MKKVIVLVGTSVVAIVVLTPGGALVVEVLRDSSVVIGGTATALASLGGYLLNLGKR